MRDRRWQTEGTTVYLLRETGRYFRGEPLMENELTIQVSGKRTKEECEELARIIRDFLNAGDA